MEALKMSNDTKSDISSGATTPTSGIGTLPAELLSPIFVLTAPDEGTHCTPAQKYEMPWGLKSVSKHWRAVSESTPALWNRIHVIMDDCESYSSYCLARAGSLIPHGTPVWLSICAYSCPVSTKAIQTLVLPNLTRLQGLRLSIPIDAFIASSLPNVQLPQLRELHLDLRSPVVKNFIDFRYSDTRLFIGILRSAVNLRHISLFSNKREIRMVLFEALLAPGSLCAQLTHANIKKLWDVELADIEALLEPCPNIEVFYADVEPNCRRQIKGSSLPLARLRELSLISTQIPPETVNLRIPWPQLNVLRLGYLRGSGFFIALLRQCHAVETLSGNIWHCTSEPCDDAAVEPDIYLPCLESFKICTIYPCGYEDLTALVAPRLLSLDINCASRSFPFEYISDLLTRSACTLRRIRLNIFARAYEMVELQNVLAGMPSVETFVSNLVLDEDTLDLIARGVLLPQVTEIEFHCATPQVFDSFVERRIESERGVVAVPLRIAVGRNKNFTKEWMA
ncbi:hypothetical protein H0H81_003116 [Sphagnurus paluster]|uniref:F-box domain-containing protein n=1 Tax=Sphagnurus paluster TaxID=117069 RepID=A0A9P7KHP3_9AGAR|nr:hypothetical protein H0H81_003116 [Sphagnurus paluster]